MHWKQWPNGHNVPTWYWSVDEVKKKQCSQFFAIISIKFPGIAIRQQWPICREWQSKCNRRGFHTALRDKYALEWMFYPDLKEASRMQWVLPADSVGPYLESCVSAITSIYIFQATTLTVWRKTRSSHAPGMLIKAQFDGQFVAFNYC